MRAANALEAIGNTPLVRLKPFEPAGSAEIWLKLEIGNPTGSYKDRMAVSVLEPFIFSWNRLNAANS